MNSSVPKIKERLSIVDVVSSYLTVEKAGKNYKAKCPFHNEKTPSFFISPERGSYYCFGCSAKGDIFSFVQHFEGTDFLGSLKILAERAGVELSQYRNKEKDKTDIYYEIMEEATLYFEKMFSINKEARSYLLGRGITDNSIKSFRIGYAPQSWNSIHDHLINKGYKKEDIEIVGLIKRKEAKSITDGSPDTQSVFRDRFYDRFRGRIMFPISDSSGRVIAFSGRIFEIVPPFGLVGTTSPTGEVITQAKYLNSPDTPLFNKSNVLFAIDKAKTAIRSRDYSIIVEGQFDVIMSHQAGFTNTVGVSGTAFTENIESNPLRHSDSEASESKINNLGLVRRLSSNIIFSFDGDEAGIRAVSRSAMIALSLDMQVKVAILPEGKDPADMILESYDNWKEIIKNSVNIISFHLDRICKNTNDIRFRGKKVREIIFPFLMMINSAIEKSAYINEIHSKTGISESAIMEDFKNYEKIQNGDSNLIKNKPIDKKEINSRRSSLEKRLFGVIFWKGETEEESKIIEEMRIKFEESIEPEYYKKMLDLYEPFSDKLVFEAEKWYSGKTNVLEKDIKEIVLNLEEEVLNERALSILNTINEKEQKNNKEDINSLIITYQKIVEKIENIKNRRYQ